MSNEKVVPIIDPIKHLRDQEGVTIHEEFTRRGWTVFLIERKHENSIVAVAKGRPATVITRSWYSKHPDRDGKMQEWGAMTDNDAPGGVIAPWSMVKRSAIASIDEMSKPDPVKD